MTVYHFHRDIQRKTYLSGVWEALTARSRLVREYATRHDRRDLIHGWSDLDPHVMDIVVDGQPLAKIESHHGTEDVHVYGDHPDAQTFIQEAITQGYKPNETKS